MSRLREDAAVHGVTIDEHITEGNPVRVIIEMCAETDLLVIGTALDRSPGRNITRHLARRSPVSLLIVPDRQPTST